MIYSCTYYAPLILLSPTPIVRVRYASLVRPEEVRGDFKNDKIKAVFTLCPSICCIFSLVFSLKQNTHFYLKKSQKILEFTYFFRHIRILFFQCEWCTDEVSSLSCHFRKPSKFSISFKSLYQYD